MIDIKSIHNYFLKCSSVAIDTRKIEPGSMFIAIKGDNFDANTFAKEALEKGAAYVVIDNADYYIDDRTILVENSLETLQELAKAHRKYLDIPIIALTAISLNENKEMLLSFGMNEVITKPFNPEYFYTVISDYIV